MDNIIFSKNFRFVEYYYKETQVRDNRTGVDMHFIGYIKKGRGVITEGEHRLEVGVGDMFYIPKGCRYISEWIADDTVRFDSLGFLYFPSRAVGGYRLQKIEYDEDILAAFLPLSRDKTLSAASIGSLYSLLGTLEGVMLEAPVSPRAAIVERLISLMNERHDASIADYARLLGVSESLLYLYVRERLGKTPNELRVEVACQKAMDMLTSTNLTIETICDKLGFSSASYFRKLMRKVYGKTPSQIRKSSGAI